MGVPVVSLAGDTHASRVGLGLLSAVGVTNEPERIEKLIRATQLLFVAESRQAHRVTR
jgi:predicted O-linked N-acetylglucosamine transferase (SPINDLY family)